MALQQIRHPFVSCMMNMYKLLIPLLLLSACQGNKKLPDVSDIQVNLEIRRFDRDFFAIDSNQSMPLLKELQKKYPDFLPLFTENVLGLGPFSDTNTLLEKGTKRFLHVSRPLYDTVQIVFPDFRAQEKALENGFRYLRYYYPNYEIPVILTTIGPMDALPVLSNMEPTPNYMGHDFIAISLPFYLGANFSIYNDMAFTSSIVPQYRSRRFSKEYMAADVFTLVLDDLHPDSSYRFPLIEQLIERGKRWYALQQLLPNEQDTIITGYTSKQLTWCKSNQRAIYNFFIQQQLFFETDPQLIRPFVSEGPGTPGLSEEAPGNIGAFLGWQIVQRWMEQNPQIGLPQLMTKPAKQIFTEANYKPR